MDLNRRFVKGEFLHVYQRSENGVLLFYGILDFLVFLSVFSVLKKRYHVTVIGLCLMLDHVHILIKTDSQETLSAFMRDLTSMYSRMFNADCGRSGRLFHYPYGSAPKVGGKKLRTAIAYLYNNPVEKSLAKAASHWQWNFLAYGNSNNPFSDSQPLAKASSRMRKAVRSLNYIYKAGNPLNYRYLRRTMVPLTDKEKKRFADYIVSQYNPIDYDELVKYYKSFETMVESFGYNTGSEYDIQETVDKSSDMIYIRMAKYLVDSGRFSNVKEVAALPPDRKAALANDLRRKFRASPHELRKFLQ